MPAAGQWIERVRQQPIRALTWLFAVAAGLLVVVYPFTLVTRPPMTDLPFHAAQVSIIRHLNDPGWHFAEQFGVHPFAVPYFSMYLVGVALSFLMPLDWAVKGMAIVMLALLPLGLGVLFAGSRKSPLLGLLGLSLVWTNLTHWGFLNYVGALGLHAMSIGCALLVVDRPTRWRQLALGAALVGVFFTHVYRLPFSLLGVVLVAVVMYPVTRRYRPLVVPWTIAALLFVAWWLVKPATLGVMPELELSLGRFGEARELLFDSFVAEAGAAEQARAGVLLAALVVVVVATTLAAWRQRSSQASEAAWQQRCLLLVGLLVVGHLAAFVVLPLRMGEWWYVYPRELVAAVLIGLAAVPTLPRSRWWRLGLVVVMGLGSASMALFVAGRWARFDQLNADFRATLEDIPRSPRLMYLMYERHSIQKRHSPFVHFPAWVQAEKGGWLSFHFAKWGIFPVRYRSDGVVPPPLPKDWEWLPQDYRHAQHGSFYDTFLVRHRIDPSELFASDASVRLLSHHGYWWLYVRQPVEAGSERDP